MKMKHEDRDQMTVLSLNGEMSRGETDRFRRELLDRLDADIRDFVIELSGLESIDSQGLEALLWLQEQSIERLGQVRLANPPEFLRDVLRATRLDGRLESHVGIKNAITSLK